MIGEGVDSRYRNAIDDKPPCPYRQQLTEETHAVHRGYPEWRLKRREKKSNRESMV